MGRMIKQVHSTEVTTTGAILTVGPTAHRYVGASVVTSGTSSGSCHARIEGSMDGVTAWAAIDGANVTISTDTTTNIVPDASPKWYPFYRLNITEYAPSITLDSATIWAAGFAGMDGEQ